MKMKKYISMLGLVFITAIWGGGFIASDMALETMTPSQIVTVRFFIAAICMGAIGFKEIKTIKKEEILCGFLLGTALFAGFAFQIIGLQYTTPSKNAFLTAVNVVMVPFITWIIIKVKIQRNSILGAILAIAGVGLLSLDNNLSLGMGDALTLLGAVGFAFQIFLTGIYVKRYSASVLNFMQMVTAFILSLMYLVITGQTNFDASGKSWLSVLYLGLISTTLAYLIQTICQKYVDETQSAIILSMESVFGTLFSVLILHEHLTKRMLLGCVLVLVAVLISNASNQEKTENTT